MLMGCGSIEQMIKEIHRMGHPFSHFRFITKMSWLYRHIFWPPTTLSMYCQKQSKHEIEHEIDVLSNLDHKLNN